MIRLLEVGGGISAPALRLVWGEAIGLLVADKGRGTCTCGNIYYISGVLFIALTFSAVRLLLRLWRDDFLEKNGFLVSIANVLLLLGAVWLTLSTMGIAIPAGSPIG